MPIEATNNFVFIIRDEADKEKDGFLIPDMGQEPPNKGTIYSVGELVQDKKIKSNRTAYFFKGTGFHVEHQGQEYLVLTQEQVIGIEK